MTFKALFPGLNRRDVAWLLGLASVVFFIEALLAREWFRLGVFSQYNVIFDDDANTGLRRFAHGWRLGGFAHPLLSYYATPGLRVVSRAGSLLGMVRDEEAFRETLALYIAPVCAGVKTALLFVAFRLLSLDASRAVLAAALSAVAFSSIVFGATPTHYAVTGCLLTLVSLMPLVAWNQTGRLPRAVAWFIASVLAVGTTSSNVIHVGSFRFANGLLSRRGAVRSLIAAALFGAIVLVTTVSANRLLTHLRAPERGAGKGAVAGMAGGMGRIVQQYSPSRAEQLTKLATFPILLGRTFVATRPLEQPNALALEHNNRIPFELTYSGAAISWRELGLGLVAVLAVAGAAWRAFRADARWRAMAAGSLMSLAVFGTLYSLFGLNAFLYTQHWQGPVALLLGAWFIPGRLSQRTVIASGVAIVLVLSVADGVVVSAVTDRIRTAGQRSNPPGEPVSGEASPRSIPYEP